MSLSHSRAVYLVRRILETIPLILFVIIVNFTLLHLAPGDPVYSLVGYGVDISNEIYDRIAQQLGLDKPLHIQLLIYIKRVITGDLGQSYFYKQPVINVIASRLGNTLILMFTALTFASIIGIIFGVISSRKPYSKIDNLISITSLIGYSLPMFWTGQVLMLFFSLRLGWFPAQGMFSLRTSQEGFDYILDILRHMFLPAMTLCIYSLALITRLTRASMLDVMSKNYITTARSKGLKEKLVIFRHGLRNAMLPVITMIGMNFGFMVAGSTLIETVFSWPGLGRLTYEALLGRDYPMLLGMLIIVSIMVIFSNLLVDIIYVYIDPRIAYEEAT